MSMQQIIEVEARTPHGTAYYYPLNEQAQNACKMFGAKKPQKSLSAGNVKSLKAMGFIIKTFAVINGKKIATGEI